MLNVLKQLVEVFDGDWTEESVSSEWAEKAMNTLDTAKKAIADLEKQEPYGWAYESHGRFTCNAHPIFWKTRKAETHKEDFWEEIPLYRHPPQPIKQEPVDFKCGDAIVRIKPPVYLTSPQPLQQEPFEYWNAVQGWVKVERDIHTCTPPKE